MEGSGLGMDFGLGRVEFEVLVSLWWKNVVCHTSGAGVGFGSDPPGCTPHPQPLTVTSLLLVSVDYLSCHDF